VREVMMMVMMIVIIIIIIVISVWKQLSVGFLVYLMAVSELHRLCY
jgi:hypothetical protein